jgi:hypothetical protein
LDSTTSLRYFRSLFLHRSPLSGDTRLVHLFTCEGCFRALCDCTSMMSTVPKIVRKSLAKWTTLLDSPILPKPLINLILEYAVSICYYHFSPECLPPKIVAERTHYVALPRCCAGGSINHLHAADKYRENEKFLSEHPDGRYEFYDCWWDGSRGKEQLATYGLQREKYRIHCFTCVSCQKTFRIARCARHESTVVPITSGKMDTIGGRLVIWETGNLSGRYELLQRDPIWKENDSFCGMCLTLLTKSNKILCDGLD